jgi:hypothetical protein
MCAKILPLNKGYNKKFHTLLQTRWAYKTFVHLRFFFKIIFKGWIFAKYFHRFTFLQKEENLSTMCAQIISLNRGYRKSCIHLYKVNGKTKLLFISDLKKISLNVVFLKKMSSLNNVC